MSDLRSVLMGLLGRGGPQTKKLAYIWVVFCSTIWLTIGIWRPFSAEWNVALGLLLTAVTTGYVGGKKVGSQARPAPGGESVAEPMGCVHTADRGTP